VEASALTSLSAWCQSPIGPVKITGTADGISEIVFARRSDPDPGPTPDELRPVVRQLEEYFRGERREFTVSLAAGGTVFQQRVWAELGKIPFGSTATYGGIAAALDSPGAARAVGRANHLNPVAIVIPCHRVIGADSELTGYGGGLWRKRWLLEHERSVALAGAPAAGPARPEMVPGRRR
jgi:methylated-DNA-[protein]-cysteine S-methyltransferase